MEAKPIWKKTCLWISGTCFATALAVVLNVPPRWMVAVILFLIGTGTLVLGGSDEIHFIWKWLKNKWRFLGASISEQFTIDDDSWDSVDGNNYQSRTYWLSVEYRKQIVDLKVKIMAIEPPIGQLSRHLPLTFIPTVAQENRAQGIKFFHHDIEIIRAVRKNQAEVTHEFRHTMVGIDKTIPYGRYKLEIVADGRADWERSRVWLDYDATRF